MATEEQKSIEISYKANIKDLISKLEQIPNVTKEEAKKMVAALDRQLKQAEKAAAKSAAAQKQAAKAMSDAAKSANRDFDKLGDSASHAAGRMEMVAEKSGDIDRGFSGVGLALRGVNPQLAEAADGMADTFAVVESLIMGFGALNPIVLAGAAVVGGLAMAYISHNAEAEKARQLVLDLRDAQRSLNDEQITAESNLLDAASKIRELRNEYGLATQQIDKYTYAVEKAAMDTGESFDANIQAANEAIAARELELATVKALLKANQQGAGATVVLSDAEKDRLRVLQLQTKYADNNLDLTQQGMNETTALLHVEDEIERRLNEQRMQLAGIEKMKTEAVGLAVQMAQFENEIAIANEQQAEALKKVKEVKQEIAEIDPFETEAVQGELNAIRARNDLQKKYAMATASDLDREIQQIQDRYAVELENVEKLATISNQESLAKDLQVELDKQRMAEIDELRTKYAEKEMEERIKAHELSKEKHQKELEQIQQKRDAILNMGSTFTSSIKTFADAMGQYLENTDKATEKSVKRLFRLQQAAAIADIVMETAKAIAAALSLPPIVRGATIAAVTAAGAAQTAVVASQQPPQLHMGGIAPDETSATLLQGEAVLDRTTVRNLGGQQGIRQLQNGNGTNNNVVIIQPFKHIDRYNRSARRMGGRVHVGAY